MKKIEYHDRRKSYLSQKAKQCFAPRAQSAQSQNTLSTIYVIYFDSKQKMSRLALAIRPILSYLYWHRSGDSTPKQSLIFWLIPPVTVVDIVTMQTFVRFLHVHWREAFQCKQYSNLFFAQKTALHSVSVDMTSTLSTYYFWNRNSWSRNSSAWHCSFSRSDKW